MRIASAATLLLSALMALTASHALAEGFDGKWIGDALARNNCASSTLVLVVSGPEIVGEIQVPGGVHHVKGTLDANGAATFKIDGRWQGTMKFVGDRFDATWTNNTCVIQGEGARAPDLTAEAALSAERKQHQTLFAQLVAKANADDKDLDYNRLRAESVYAETWQFYDTLATGLMDQARVAVKGKDCAVALDKLDQILKLDFVIDEAHALRADCLRQLHRDSEARAEQDIADGLKHSLLQSWAGDHTFLRALSEGDGAQVDSAYFITTHREEVEVLSQAYSDQIKALGLTAIQLKMRQTLIRGSDGRYYNVIKTTPVAGEPGVGMKNLYFDVTSFIQGRVSQRAVADTAVASA